MFYFKEKVKKVITLKGNHLGLFEMASHILHTHQNFIKTESN